MSIKSSVAFLILTGIALRVFILCLPGVELLHRWGSDDLFYYTQIAGHIANGNGPSFDGLNLTNGFQPLFMAVLMPFGKFFLNDPQSALRCLLLLNSIFTLIAAFQVKAVFSYWKMRDLGLIIAGLLFIHPKILSVTFHGTEAALTLLMIALALRAMQLIEQNKNLTWCTLAFTGLVLVRFDMALLLACLMVFLLWKKQPLSRLILVNLLPGVALICWLSSNWHFFGHIIPDSGLAKSLHGAVIAETSQVKPHLRFFANIKGAVHTTLMAESRLSISTLLFSGLGLIGFLGIKYKQGHEYKPYLVILFIGGCLIMTASIIKLNSFRDWYLMPLFITVICLMSIGIDMARRKFKYGNWILVFVSALLWAEAQSYPRTHMAPHYFEAARYIEQNIPPGTKIGAFNAGLYGARLGGQYPIINLDGVVNHSVIKYLKAKELLEYIDTNQINWLVDHSGSVNFYSQFSNQDLNEKFEQNQVIRFRGETSDITVYRRKSGR